jgi:hypothetical protein
MFETPGMAIDLNQGTQPMRKKPWHGDRMGGLATLICTIAKSAMALDDPALTW